MGVKWRVGTANGRKLRKEKGLLSGLKYQDFRLEAESTWERKQEFVVERNSAWRAKAHVSPLFQMSELKLRPPLPKRESRWGYSFRAGWRTATRKWAKWDAPSSICSQRTTQWSERYLETRASGMPRCSASCGLMEGSLRRAEPPRTRLGMATRRVLQDST